LNGTSGLNRSSPTTFQPSSFTASCTALAFLRRPKNAATAPWPRWRATRNASEAPMVAATMTSGIPQSPYASPAVIDRMAPGTSATTPAM